MCIKEYLHSFYSMSILREILVSGKCNFWKTFKGKYPKFHILYTTENFWNAYAQAKDFSFWN